MATGGSILEGVNVLPDCRLKQPKGIICWPNGMRWQPIFCANCGADGGMVPEENCNFAFYLCDPCAVKLGPIAGTYMEPDAVFWQKVHDEQISKYGRELQPHELVEVLKDENSTLSKLCKDRTKFNVE